MTVGNEVNKGIFDYKLFTAIVELRTAFEKIDALAAFLAVNPRPQGQPDPLDAKFSYTPAESYLARNTVESLQAARVSLDGVFNDARQITGLE